MGSHVDLSTKWNDVIERFTCIFNKEAIEKASERKCNNSDIVLCGTPKTGTTWIQHIMHGLRSRGNMDFEEMSLVVPIVEILELLKDAYKVEKTLYLPTLYKTHLRYDLVPKGNARHIIIVRNPPDVTVSSYHYFAGWLFRKDEMTLVEFVDLFYTNPNSPFEAKVILRGMNFIAKAFPHRLDDRVLWLHYEDLKQDLRSCVRIISDFMEIGVGDQQLLDLVEYQSSFEFMKKHEHKFNTSQLSQSTKKIMKNPLSSENSTGGYSKVRKGDMYQGKEELSPELIALLDKEWKQTVQPICGYATYEEMRDGINKELGRSFGHKAHQK